MTLPVRRLTALLCVSVATWLLGSPTRADDTTPPTVTLQPVVVSATRLPTPEEQVASSVTVITAQDIARKQQRTLPDVLADVPGLNIVQAGGPGAQTSVFIRGTDANHTKVFVDGIDMNDPSSPNGAFDFSQILASDIERVEVLRGPQSGLYGSDAIGGVIDITTRKGTGPAQWHASVEGGSFGTFNQTAGVSGSVARFNYAFDFQHNQSADSQVTPANLVPLGRPVNSDYYDNKTYSTRLGAELSDILDVGLVARYVATTLRSTADDYLGPEATPSESTNQEFFTRAAAHLVLFDGRFEQTLGVGFTDYRRRYLDPNDLPATPSFERGDRVKLDWQGNITLMPGEVLTLGAEHQLDEMAEPVVAQMTNDAGYAQLQSSFGPYFFNTISARYDDNDRFGSKPTFREAPAVLIPQTGTKLKASVGTGFKAPTLDQLFDSYPEFDFYANPNLKPETSVGYDVGFEQTLAAERIQFGATWFHNDIRNLIGYNASFTSNINIGQATTEGIESFLAYKPIPAVALRADYTYTYAEDDILHQELPRRPKDKVSLNATWQVTAKASMSATVIYVGPWVDVNRAGTVGLTANGYTLVNLAGSYDLGHGLTAFARIDNALDQRYQDPTGFLRPGLGVFGGLRVAFTNPG
jgi:vitamin B12 transporter